MAKQNNLLEVVRGVETLDGRVPVYAEAEISLETVNPASLRPTALYVIREKLKRVHQMRKDMKAVGVDPYLSGDLLEYKGHVVAPPIIEGNEIVDGIHRCWDSFQNGREITIIRIKGASEKYPSIGSPVDWEQVKIVDTKPDIGTECRVLKDGILDDPIILRKHFRDFSVLGSSGRRPRIGQFG